jgi:hypothetical protein
LRDNVEISFNIESELLVELTLGWLIWILISIDDLPSLVDFTMLVMHNDVSVFSINATLNIKHFSFFVGEILTVLQSE